MRVRIVDAGLHATTIRTRIPFKFGVQVLVEVPLAELELTVEDPSGEQVRGLSSDLLVPKWFEKNPDTSPEEDSTALASSVEMAAATGCTLGSVAGPHPAFELWSVLHAEHVGQRNHLDADVLVRGFGVSMVERALIDATCRLAGRPFHAALRDGILGFNPRRIIPETAGWEPERLPEPRGSMQVRHTIGMLDPLTTAEVPDDQSGDDGLPRSLDEVIAMYGVRWFKIKVSGDYEHDRERLRSIASVLEKSGADDFQVTLDGNEQCNDLDAFAGMLEELGSDTLTGPLVERIRLIEQPLPRTSTFEAEANSSIGRLGRIAPVIIDEADTDFDAFRRAIELGYAGVSVKACKGVFRAIANRALVDVRSEAGHANLLQSGEDLTNLGSIPLQQDLALQATLGITQVERNGHHYFRGLDHLPAQARKDLLASLPELYCSGETVDRLRIEDGTIRLEGINEGTGLGGTIRSFREEDA